MITKQQLQKDLEALGIRSDETVAVHTSLKAVGMVEGGAETFLEALYEYLYDGLLVIPTHTWKNVNQENPWYDVRGSEACIGWVPRTAAFHPKAVRSMHATHSVAVFGKRAGEYAAYDRASVTPTPPQGCFGRLYDEKAKILLVGVGQERNTFIHVSEEILDVPQRLSAPFEVTLVDYEGRQERRTIQKHENPICPHISENFVKFDPYLARCGAVTEGKLGNAVVKVCDAVKLQDEILRLWRESDRDLTVDARPIDG